MSFIEEFKQKCISESVAKFSDSQVVAKNLVPIEPLMALSYQLVQDLALPTDTDITEKEEEGWNWFSYVLHKGIVASIASRYGRNDIKLNYSFEEAKVGKHPSYAITLLPIKGEYSFNLRYNLPKADWMVQEIYYNVIDFLKENKLRIQEENVNSNDILYSFLAFAGIIGINFTNRIELTKDDYWPIRQLFTNRDEAMNDDSDLVEVDRLGEFKEPVTENKDTYQVNCSYCGMPALIIPKAGDVWNEAVLDPCEHFSFAFITNTNNHLYGREYYRKSFRRSVIDYVETYKGYTCQSNPESFINDFYNGDTDLDERDKASIMVILKSGLPDCTIDTKQFEKKLNGEKHVFDFHFMKFI